MAVTVNRKGVSHARSLIAAGKIDEGAWSFSGADGNALLGDPPDWSAYGKWFLAVDSEADSETKEHYKYPFGKSGKIYRRGVIAAKSRAAQQGLTAVAETADNLLKAIDKKLGKDEDKSAGETERRYLPFGEEMRAFEDGESLIIEGYPIVYDVYAPIGWFREIIRVGAATKALKNADELVLWDHESGQPMARRSASTLKVAEDEYGVFIRADVSKTRWGRDGYEAIKNKVITKMSFAFDMNGGEEKWPKEEIEGVQIETREILSFGHLYDYSPVSFPAYKTTSVNARMIELATRNRPVPELSGAADAVASEELLVPRNQIVRGRIDNMFFEKEK